MYNCQYSFTWTNQEQQKARKTVIVHVKAVESEDKLRLHILFVADVTDIKAIAYFLLKDIMTEEEKTIFEQIKNFLLSRNCETYVHFKVMRHEYSCKKSDRIVSSFPTFNEVMTRNASNCVHEKWISENFKSLASTGLWARSDTAEKGDNGNVSFLNEGIDIPSEEDIMEDEDKDYHEKHDKETPTLDECIGISGNNANKTENVNSNHENENKGEQAKGKRTFTRRKRNTCEETTHTTRENVSSIFLFVLTTYKLFRVKPSKKAFLILVMILCGQTLTTAAPVQEPSEKRALYEYRLLLTSNCNYRDLILSGTCQVNEEQRNAFIDYCGFADTCDPGYKPLCVNGDGGGMLYICSPKDLTCPKGYRRRAWLNDTSSEIVLVLEEKCPKGTFQPDKSNCYDACANVHENIRYLPEQYAEYSKGDNMSPPWIYCDFEKGFFNMDGKFLLPYDENFKHVHKFCTSVLDYNPCTGKEYPLPNGTCVLPCEGTFKRDAHDGFQCKVKNGVDVVVNTDGMPDLAEEYKSTTSMETLTSKEETSKHLTTQNQRRETEDADGIHQNTLITVLSAVLIAVFIILPLFLCIIVRIHLKRQKPKSVRIQYDNRIIQKIKSAGTVNIDNSKSTNQYDPDEIQPCLEENEQD